MSAMIYTLVQTPRFTASIRSTTGPSWRQFTFIALLVASFAFIDKASAEDVEFHQNTAFAAQDIERRAADIFSVPIAGETYSELSGEVGHQATDMTLNGNGLLSFDLTRNFEPVSSAYPYPLATMSLVIPKLTIETLYIDNGGPTPGNFHCDDWVDEKTADADRAPYVYNAMSFEHEKGSTQLQIRELANPDFAALFPNDAIYMSTDHYYLSCDAENFVIHSPAGEQYIFTVQGAERIRQGRWRGSTLSNVFQLHNKYILYAVEKRRLTATIKYEYDVAPNFLHDEHGNPQRHPVNAPLRSRKSESRKSGYQTVRPAGDYSGIDRKTRLTSVTLKVDGENDRSINLKYRGTDPGTLCPGLLEAVTSNATNHRQVIYKYIRYESLASGQPRADGIPPSLCVLSRVTRADGSTWEFDYGKSVDAQFSLPGKSQYYPSSSTLVQYNSEKGDGIKYGDFYAYLPLRSVKVPTGAQVTYNYLEAGLGLCEYQDHQRIGYRDHLWYGEYDYANPRDSCRREGGKIAPRKPALTARIVAGPDIPSTETNISYFKNTDTQYDVDTYTVERWIADDMRTTRLIFHRIDRVKNPISTSMRMMNGGRLKALQLYEGKVRRIDALSMDPVATIDYTYTEKPNAFRLRDGRWRDEPEDSSHRFWREMNNTSSYAYDTRQVRLGTKYFRIDGQGFYSSYYSPDDYNNPTRVDERQFGKETNQRTVYLEYDNDHENKKVWFVKALESRKILIGLTSAGAKFTYAGNQYNSKGLVKQTVYDGVTTDYLYHDSGDVMEVSSGGTVTQFDHYKNGVATFEYSGSGGDAALTRREVDDAGNVTKITDPEGRVTSFGYRHSDHALDRVVPPAPLGVTVITPPNWQGDRIQQSSEPGTNTFLYFDALGRETLRASHDKNGPSVRILRKTYDAYGRMIYFSDPVGTNDRSAIDGTHVSYDALGRVTTSRHQTEATGVRYCYGPSCDSSSTFNTAGSVKFGYARRDQSGYVSVYNFRAFGTPGNRELMEIRQQVVHSDETPGAGSSGVVVTTLERNRDGFVTAVIQGGTSNDSREVRREFTPFEVNGFVTAMGGAEVHPELGTRTVSARDAAGRVTHRTGFDGSIYYYEYNTYGDLRLVQQAFRPPGAKPVPTTIYKHDTSGLLTDILHGDVARTYGYDGAGQLDWERLSIDGKLFDIYYKHDDAGAVTEVTYPSGRSVVFDRNGFGETTKVVGFADNVIYHPNGLLKSYGLSNGTSYLMRTTSLMRPWKLDVDGPDGALVRQTTVYDPRGNIRRIHGHFAPFGTDLDNMTYDGLSRLLTANGRWGSARYWYDDSNNLIRADIDGQSRRYHMNADNRLHSTTTVPGSIETVDYDSSGNIRQHGTDTNEFDGANRLVQSVRDGYVQRNTYDGNDLRVKTVVDVSGSGGGSRRATTYSVYTRAGELLHEFDLEMGEERDHIRLADRTIAIVGTHTRHDSDKDGMPDYFERHSGLDAFSRFDRSRDLDGDGLSNVLEYQGGSKPNQRDSDGDGVSDLEDPDVFVPPYARGVILEPIFDFATSD